MNKNTNIFYVIYKNCKISFENVKKLFLNK